MAVSERGQVLQMELLRGRKRIRGQRDTQEEEAEAGLRISGAPGLEEELKVWAIVWVPLVTFQWLRLIPVRMAMFRWAYPRRHGG